VSLMLVPCFCYSLTIKIKASYFSKALVDHLVLYPRRQIFSAHVFGDGQQDFKEYTSDCSIQNFQH
jgi:hypothetical protein